MIKVFLWLIVFIFAGVYNTEVVLTFLKYKITTSIVALTLILCITIFFLNLTFIIFSMPQYLLKKMNSSNTKELLMAYAYGITNDLSRLSQCRLGNKSIHDLILRYKIEKNIDRKVKLLKKIKENEEFREFSNRELAEILLKNKMYNDALELAYAKDDKELMLMIYIAKQDFESLEKTLKVLALGNFEIADYFIKAFLNTDKIEEKKIFMQKAIQFFHDQPAPN